MSVRIEKNNWGGVNVFHPDPSYKPLQTSKTQSTSSYTPSISSGGGGSGGANSGDGCACTTAGIIFGFCCFLALCCVVGIILIALNNHAGLVRIEWIALPSAILFIIVVFECFQYCLRDNCCPGRLGFEIV